MSNEIFEAGSVVYAAFIDENDIKREGMFTIALVNEQSVTLKSKNSSLILVPMSRVLKLKKRCSDEI